MTRSLRALRATVVVSTLGYAAQALSLVAIPLFLRTVGAEDYGLMVTVMAFMGYVGFADAGLGWSSMVLIAQAHGRGERSQIAHIVRHSAVLALGSGALAALVTGAVLLAARSGWRLPMFAHHREADGLLVIAALQLIGNLVFGVVYNLFQGLQQSYWTGLYQGAGRLGGLAAAMLACLWFHSIAGMMWTQTAMSFVAGLAATLHARRLHPWAFAAGSFVDREQYRSQLLVGSKSFVLQIGRTIGGTAPTLAISSVLGAAVVPFYTVPTTLLSLFFAPINSWSSNLQSAYGEAWESGDRAWVKTAFLRSLERILLLGGLGLALFFALGDYFMREWTHARLSLDGGAASSIALVAVTGATLAAGQYLLTGLNLHRRAAVAEMANGLGTLALVSVGVRLWGLAGIGPGAAASALASSGWVLWREVRTALGPNCYPSIGFILKVGGATAIATLAASLAWRDPTSGNLWSFALSLSSAAIVGGMAFAAVAAGLRILPVTDLLAVVQRLVPRRSISLP